MFSRSCSCGFLFFFSSRRRHTRWTGDWSSDVCSSDLSGPAFDGYVLRLAAVAASNAIDQVLAGSARCFIENATVVPLGSCEVAVVVLLLAHGGWVEELSGSAVVNGDQRQAIVRATLAAVNRRLEALLP